MTMKQNNKIRYDLLSFTDLKKMETWLNNESLLMTYIPQVPILGTTVMCKSLFQFP